MIDHKVMDFALLTPQEMGQADHLTIKSDLLSGYQLMLNAGKAVTNVLLQFFASARNVAILCGPGNNGGDGYVVASHLRTLNIQSTCFANYSPRPDSDAEIAARDWNENISPIANFNPDQFDVVIDALYGAGLDRPISEHDKQAIDRLNASNVPVIAVDLPSGVSGLRGGILGVAVRANVTVTFFRPKPGHLLYPGKALCGHLVCADIGISDQVLDDIAPTVFANNRDFWLPHFPVLDYNAHKYSRGHAIVFSGPPCATGAARLAARAAARSGAGAVTLLATAAALLVNATQLTSIMLHIYDDVPDAMNYAHKRKVKSAILGPGFGNRIRARDITRNLLAEHNLHALVLDADAITAFEEAPHHLFNAAQNSSVALILTPHEGEFLRLFPDIAQNNILSRLEKAQLAAKRAHAIIILKGADTVIAAPDGRAAINMNGTPLLATAGSGDVLTGICGGLTAQNMPPFEAACAAVYLHAEAAKLFGPGLIAEDIIDTLPKVLPDMTSKSEISYSQPI